jgi:hypothetical protein
VISERLVSDAEKDKGMTRRSGTEAADCRRGLPVRSTAGVDCKG